MKMIRLTVCLLITQCFLLVAYGQNTPEFHPPMKIPMYLSGNFGEIRSDHFHSGIDIKTQGTIGHRISAVESGHVSRIKVQANGYGKSIYISHTNGFTSVYGHLDRYRDDIAEYVKNMQYKRQSHMVDLYPDPSAFPVEKGELLAYSGNTGSSSGPHLHFEIRNSANQHPTNVLHYNFDIRDQVAPRFRSLRLYPMEEGALVNGKSEAASSTLVKDQGKYTLPWGTRMEAYGEIGLSVEVFDYLNGASNRCGIYSLEMYVDEELRYRHVMDEFAFSETRYINAHIDYQIRSSKGIKAHRLHRLPNNPLRIYDREAGNEVIKLDEARKYRIRVVAADVAGNTSVLHFNIHGDTLSKPEPIKLKDGQLAFRYYQANTFNNDQLSLEIPANSLYRDYQFTTSSSPASEASLTPFYQVGNKEVPLHKAYTLSVKCPPLKEALRNKLLLISRNEEQEIESAGGEYINGWVVARLRNFGSYAIGLDTIPPQIRPRNGNISGDLSSRKSLSFYIQDDLSGIGRYEGYIDNRWALFEYDPKNNLLLYTLDEERIKRDSEHELELYVTDGKGNVSLIHTTFTW
jgi:murein DD-endopeptidase MepM/ murein hydrolase activator NlpD